MSANYYVLLFFAPVLIITGIAGFLIPKEKGLTSGVPAYNIFHIVFGMIGLGIIYSNNELAIRSFNIGSGLIDLYQLLANRLGLFPQNYFRWTSVDDVLHLVIGGILVLIGVFAS